MNIILIAPPAAGKGTQAEKICKKYNLNHVSTGDLLREEMNKKNSLGKEISEKMQQGKLIDDNIILNLVENKIKEENNFVFDGFPRNISQAIELSKMLDANNKKIDYVIYLKIEKALAQARVVNRYICPNCKKVYNFDDDLKHNCDNCESELFKRDDDNIETFNNRFDIYEKETKPIIDYYREKKLLFEVDSSNAPDKVFKQIEQIIGVE